MLATVRFFGMIFPIKLKTFITYYTSIIAEFDLIVNQLSILFINSTRVIELFLF